MLLRMTLAYAHTSVGDKNIINLSCDTISWGCAFIRFSISSRRRRPPWSGIFNRHSWLKRALPFPPSECSLTHPTHRFSFRMWHSRIYCLASHTRYFKRVRAEGSPNTVNITWCEALNVNFFLDAFSRESEEEKRKTFCHSLNAYGISNIRGT